MFVMARHQKESIIFGNHFARHQSASMMCPSNEGGSLRAATTLKSARGYLTYTRWHPIEHVMMRIGQNLIGHWGMAATSKADIAWFQWWIDFAHTQFIVLSKSADIEQDPIRLVSADDSIRWYSSVTCILPRDIHRWIKSSYCNKRKAFYSIQRRSYVWNDNSTLPGPFLKFNFLSKCSSIKTSRRKIFSCITKQDLIWNMGAFPYFSRSVL